MTLTFKVTVEPRLVSGDGETASLLEQSLIDILLDAEPLLKVVIEADDGEEVYEIVNWGVEPLYGEEP